MMSVTRTTETFLTKCVRCHNTWRAMCEVDLIDWDNGLSSVVAAKSIECPRCRRWGPLKKVKNNKI